MEVLSSPEKRRQFDSVDAEVEDDIPEPKDTTPENFFELWAPVFEREGRFSVVQPVPQLGDDKAAKGDVEAFYNFWYSIDSWRTFEALDKDVNEGSDRCVLWFRRVAPGRIACADAFPPCSNSRDEKRHNEKKNKSERQKRKKEDNTRVRTLVDAALALDPRIKQFKADEKAARDAKKKGGVAGVVDVKKQEEEVKAKADAEAAAAAEAAKSAADDKVRHLPFEGLWRLVLPLRLSPDAFNSLTTAVLSPRPLARRRRRSRPPRPRTSRRTARPSRPS